MPTKIRSSRTRSYVDPSVQGALLRKLSVHWFVLIAVNCGVFGTWTWLFERVDASASDAMSTAFSTCLPFLVTSAALLPVFLFDTLKLTSRFAGPALRLRAALSDASQGLPVRPLQFRHDDFWQEMADSFNVLIERQDELARAAEHSEFAAGAKREPEPLPGKPRDETGDSALPSVPSVRSADEALRLLDTVNA